MNECNIVRDLIPLYADELLSSDSVEFIQRHIRGCPQCRKVWQRYEQALPEIQVQNPNSEKRIIKKALRRDRVKTMAKTLLAVMIALTLFVCCYAIPTCYQYGLFYPIEDACTAPDGSRALELVERDFFLNHGDGYMIRFNFERGIGGINRYWTDWDTIEPHWAPDSIHLLLMLTTVEGEPEIRIVDTVVQETQGGTWEIPGLSENLIPTLTELCGATEDVTFTFSHWSDNSELLVFDYETASGESGQITFPRPIIPEKIYD